MTAESPDRGAGIDANVARFLEREESPSNPALTVFLEEVEPSLRDECRRRILIALEARSQIAAMRGEPHSVSASGDAPAPAIAGFRIERRLGAGGMGTVYAAWDENLERPVAIKVLHHAGEGGRVRVLDEARRVAALQHPGIVTVHAVVESEPPAIVMELVQGTPIDRGLRHLSAAKKAAVLCRVARALAAAAERGVIHRDLKPANILVTADLEPKILDFGLALHEQDRGALAARGAFAGSPEYASPEQAAGESLTPASDVFSFGTVMFTVLTGQPPFRGDTLADVLASVRRAEPPFPRAAGRAADVPEDLQAICLACLARDPAQRPSAAALATDLGRFVVGEPVRSRPALFGEILHRQVAAHQGEIGDWQTQGMISGGERDRLDLVYRRIVADEDHWIVDARRLTLAQTVLYTSTWTAVVAMVLLVWLVRADVSSLVRWLVPAFATVVLAVAGVVALRREETMAAGAFLAGAVLAAVPAALSALAELSIGATRPAGIEQLLGEPFSNLQVVVASATGLVVSIVALARVRLTGFAWTTAVLAATTWVSLLLVFDFLDWQPEKQAFWCLPLVALEAFALRFESRRRVRWALPFHLVALATLVVALDVIAIDGPTLELLGLEPAAAAAGEQAPFYDESRAHAFSLALNGIVFMAVMLWMERSSSLDLRRGSQLMEILGPIHLLGALYASARANEKSAYVAADACIYMTAVIALLALGPWRERRRFLMAGLAGVALGCHLLVDLELVKRAPFVLALGAVGLAVAIGAFVWLFVRPRAGA